MNLQENIQRIKEVMGLHIEEELPRGFDKVRQVSYVYDKGVEDLQKFLVSKNYDLGTYGPNHNGVDGKYGAVTKKAHQDYLNNVLPTKSEPKKSEPSITTSSSSANGDVILMGGLDYRPGDLKISQQIDVLKNNSSKKNIIGHRYNQFSDVENSISQNPDATVVLFSAGCGYASKVAALMKNKNRLFIVEPYAVSQGTANSVQGAVAQGVPASNVITGPIEARGSGVVGGSTKTPSGLSHWDALKFVSSMI